MKALFGSVFGENQERKGVVKVAKVSFYKRRFAQSDRKYFNGSTRQWPLEFSSILNFDEYKRLIDTRVNVCQVLMRINITQNLLKQ